MSRWQVFREKHPVVVKTARGAVIAMPLWVEPTWALVSDKPLIPAFLGWAQDAWGQRGPGLLNWLTVGVLALLFYLPEIKRWMAAGVECRRGLTAPSISPSKSVTVDLSQKPEDGLGKAWQLADEEPVVATARNVALTTAPSDSPISREVLAFIADRTHDRPDEGHLELLGLLGTFGTTKSQAFDEQTSEIFLKTYAHRVAAVVAWLKQKSDHDVSDIDLNYTARLRPAKIAGVAHRLKFMGR